VLPGARLVTEKQVQLIRSACSLQPIPATASYPSEKGRHQHPPPVIHRLLDGRLLVASSHSARCSRQPQTIKPRPKSVHLDELVLALPFFLARKDQQPAGGRDAARTSEEPEMILWSPFGVPESSLVYPLVLLYCSLASAFRSRRMVCF
jgi:hypothetical protein